MSGRHKNEYPKEEEEQIADPVLESQPDPEPEPQPEPEPKPVEAAPRVRMSGYELKQIRREERRQKKAAAAA